MGRFVMRLNRNVCPLDARAAACVLTVIAALQSGCAIQNGIDRESVLRAEEATVVQRDRITAAAYQQDAIGIVAPELEEALQELVEELAEAADCPIPCRVHVVNLPMRQASVLSSGDIFVFSGLLDLVDNRDQLAVVLGHEIAHLVHKDALGKLQLEVRESQKAAVSAALLGAVLSGAASGAVSGALGSVLGSLDPRVAGVIPQQVTSVPSDIAARLAASLPLPMVLSLMRQTTNRYSQEAELRADDCSLEYARRAGYDPNAGVEIIQKLKEAERLSEGAPAEAD